jgi:ketosteroid isomerase-like protein
MFSHIYSLCLCFSILLGFTASGADQGASREAEQELRRIDDRYIEAFNKKSAEELSSLYADSAEIYHPNKDLIRGRKAIEAFWREDLASTPSKQKTEIVTVDVEGNTGIIAGKWTLDGDKPQKGKYLLVLKRIGSKWQITREIWNDQTATQ